MTDIRDLGRTASKLTDAELLAAVNLMPQLQSRSTADDRIAHDRVLRELNRRLGERLAVDELGCNDTECHYPTTVGLRLGIDISIDGDVWPGSAYSTHIDRCPYHQYRGNA